LFVREQSAEITFFKHARSFGAVPFWARQSSFEGLHRWAGAIEAVTPTFLQRGRFAVPGKMIASLRTA